MTLRTRNSLIRINRDVDGIYKIHRINSFICRTNGSAMKRVPGFKSSGPILEILRAELSRRIERNSSYSLRSFARQLGISHTLLSLILNGHRPPSKAIAEKVLLFSDLSKEQANLILKSIDPDKVKGAMSRAFHKLDLDQFALFAEWQHYAILSLLEVPDTEFTPEFIAKRLGISVMIAKVSMERLIDLDLIELREDGRWRQKVGPIVVENTRSTEASRKFQKQLINKALDSIDEDPMEVRDMSSTTFAMHPKHVPYALQKIREFRRKLTAELEEFGMPKEVYNLTVQLFPSSHRRDP